MIRETQLSLIIVFEAKHSQMEHTAIIITQEVLSFGFLAHGTADEAKFASTHVGERGHQVLLSFPAKQFVLHQLPIQFHCAELYWSFAAVVKGKLAATNIPIPAKTNPCV